jgi:hypothetical protein
MRGWLHRSRRFAGGSMPTGRLPIFNSMQTVLSCPFPSNHVGTVRWSFETMPAGPDRTTAAEIWPAGLRDLPLTFDSSNDVQPSAYILSLGDAAPRTQLSRPLPKSHGIASICPSQMLFWVALLAHTGTMLRNRGAEKEL